MVLLPLRLHYFYQRRKDSIDGVHDRLHIYPLCGIFYFPWHRHQIEGTTGFPCFFRMTLAKSGKGNCQSFPAASVGFEPRTPWSPVTVLSSNHRATAVCSMVLCHVMTGSLPCTLLLTLVTACLDKWTRVVRRTQFTRIKLY